MIGVAGSYVCGRFGSSLHANAQSGLISEAKISRRPGWVGIPESGDTEAFWHKSGRDETNENSRRLSRSRTFDLQNSDIVETISK